jgi:hypothetical protein
VPTARTRTRQKADRATKATARSTQGAEQGKAKAKASRKTRSRPSRLGAKALKALFETDSRQSVPARLDLGHVAAAAAPADAMMGIAVAAAADTGSLKFVATVSNDGPWELRSLVVNDFQVLDKTMPATTRRIDVPIPAVFGQQLRLTWSILAAHLIPTVATFVQDGGNPPVSLGQKNALKKGESWAPLDTVPFPPA